MNNLIYVCENLNAKYPTDKFCFSPSIRYPEYDFNEIADEKNDVYDMVRNCLIGLKLDEKNIGTKDWNPFKDFIKEGDNVLIKPNFVRDINLIEENGTDCLTTHTSVIRPVIDYVIKALNGTGKIILADAPVQNCDFDNLVKSKKLDHLVEYYKSKNIIVELFDLRLSGNKVSSEDILDRPQGIEIDLKEKSSFSTLNKKQLKRLRITNYPKELMQKAHSKANHIYSISQVALNADVIINLPKPKTHKKGGATISLKNMFGTVSKKEYLPHHSLGAKNNGGDEYPHKSLLKHQETLICEQQDNLSAKKKSNRFLNFLRKSVCKLQRIFKTDNVKEGSWYGNDTLWRTICDINKILIYCDKSGHIFSTPQRKMFILADMIVSGEKEGPVAPSPKQVGMIIAGFNNVNFDKVVATLMGFDFNKIPSIKNANEHIYNSTSCSDFVIKSNNLNLNNFSNLNFDVNLKYEPSSNWVGYIEK